MKHKGIPGGSIVSIATLPVIGKLKIMEWFALYFAVVQNIVLGFAHPVYAELVLLLPVIRFIVSQHVMLMLIVILVVTVLVMLIRLILLVAILQLVVHVMLLIVIVVCQNAVLPVMPVILLTV
jgi:hypothetical protein